MSGADELHRPVLDANAEWGGGQMHVVEAEAKWREAEISGEGSGGKWWAANASGGVANTSGRQQRQLVVAVTSVTGRPVQNVRYRTSGTRRPVQDVRYRTSGTGCLVQDVLYRTSCTRHNSRNSKLYKN